MAKTYRGVATSGLNAKLPRLEIWASQFPQPTITIVDPEYNATCPKTGLADFGTVTIRYEPAARCIELKSFKPGWSSRRSCRLRSSPSASPAATNRVPSGAAGNSRSVVGHRFLSHRLAGRSIINLDAYPEFAR